MDSLSSSTLPLLPRATWNPWAGGEAPNLQADPYTELPCVMWQDGDEKTCEETRDYWNITPEQFTSWNPSVGLDCKPWSRQQSYCVVPLSRTQTSSSSNETPGPTTTSISVPTSSPTGWDLVGCYEYSQEEVFYFERMRLEEDTLTIKKCQDACYRNDFLFAGLAEGNMCWCSLQIAGDRELQSTGCNVTCSGNDSQTCGGEGHLSVYESKYDGEDEEDEDGEADDGEGEEEANRSGSNRDEESSGSRYRPFFGMI